MKRWFTLLLPCILGMTVLSGYVSPEDRKYVDYFLRLQAADLFRTRQFLLNSSWSYISRKQIERIDLSFTYFRSLTWDQARQLIVSVAMELVEKINSDSTMKAKHLLPEPFTLDQLALEIRTDNICSADADIVTIQRMCLNHGQLTYYSYPASALFYGRTTTYKESFQQALMLLDLPTEFDSEASTLVAPKEAEQRVIEESQMPIMTPSPEEIQRAVEPADVPVMKPLMKEPKRIDVEVENGLREEKPKTNDQVGMVVDTTANALSLPKEQAYGSSLQRIDLEAENGLQEEKPDDLIGMLIETIANTLSLPKEQEGVQRQKIDVAAFPPSVHKRSHSIEVEVTSLPVDSFREPCREQWQATVFPDAPTPISPQVIQMNETPSPEVPEENEQEEGPTVAGLSLLPETAPCNLFYKTFPVWFTPSTALPEEPVQDEVIAVVEGVPEEPILPPTQPLQEPPSGESQKAELVSPPLEEKNQSMAFDPEQDGFLDRFIASLQSFWGHEENGSPLEQEDSDFEDEDMENSQTEQTKGALTLEA